MSLLSTPEPAIFLSAQQCAWDGKHLVVTNKKKAVHTFSREQLNQFEPRLVFLCFSMKKKYGADTAAIGNAIRLSYRLWTSAKQLILTENSGTRLYHIDEIAWLSPTPPVAGFVYADFTRFDVKNPNRRTPSCEKLISDRRYLPIAWLDNYLEGSSRRVKEGLALDLDRQSLTRYAIGQDHVSNGVKQVALPDNIMSYTRDGYNK